MVQYLLCFDKYPINITIFSFKEGKFSIKLQGKTYEKSKNIIFMANWETKTFKVLMNTNTRKHFETNHLSSLSLIHFLKTRKKKFGLLLIHGSDCIIQRVRNGGGKCVASLEYVQISVSDSSMVVFQCYRYHHEQMDLPGSSFNKWDIFLLLFNFLFLILICVWNLLPLCCRNWILSFHCQFHVFISYVHQLELTLWSKS